MAQGFIGTRLNPDIEMHAQIIDYTEELPNKSDFLRAVLYKIAIGEIDISGIDIFQVDSRVDSKERMDGKNEDCIGKT